MSERIKPNAEHRIVDGEIIPGEIDEKIQRGREFSEQKEALKETDQKEFAESFKQEESGSEDPDSILKDVDPQASISEWLEPPTFFQRYGSWFFSFLLFLILFIIMIVTRPDSDWQIQKINDLQTEVSILDEKNQQLLQQFQEVEAKNHDQIIEQVNTIFSKPENRPAVSQDDIYQLEKKLKQRLAKLETELASYSNNASEQIEKSLEELKKNSTQLSPEASQKLKELESTLQNQLQEASKKFEDLFLFKKEQKILTDRPTKISLDAPLDSLQIQQWIVEVNTQWMLHGRIAETQQQLFALEQAVSLSDYAYTTELARLIGQDLGYLKQLQDKSLKLPVPDTTQLKKAIASLTEDNIEKLKSAQAEIKPENKAEPSGMEKLMDSFSQLISVKKRQSDTQITEVNSILLNDVMKQRLALLVDRLQWGITTHSKPVVDQTVSDIQEFINQNYTNQSARFNGLLDPFKHIEFVSKRPLTILSLDDAMQQ